MLQQVEGIQQRLGAPALLRSARKSGVPSSPDNHDLAIDQERMRLKSSRQFRQWKGSGRPSSLPLRVKQRTMRYAVPGTISREPSLFTSDEPTAGRTVVARPDGRHGSTKPEGCRTVHGRRFNPQGEYGPIRPPSPSYLQIACLLRIVWTREAGAGRAAQLPSFPARVMSYRNTFRGGSYRSLWSV